MADQDFDSMRYILPFNFEVTYDDFREDNSIRLGRSSSDTRAINQIGEMVSETLFIIRNFEKVFLLFSIMLALYGSIKQFKKINDNLLLLELFLIGTTLIFIVVETQPRYLLFSMIAIIIYAANILGIDKTKN